jgi:hypothetical protein
MQGGSCCTIASLVFFIFSPRNCITEQSFSSGQRVASAMHEHAKKTNNKTKFWVTDDQKQTEKHKLLSFLFINKRLVRRSMTSFFTLSVFISTWK